MRNLYYSAARCYEPARTWGLARQHAAPLPEYALHDALADLEWFELLTPENLEQGYEFAREFDLPEQEPDAMAERVELVRREVAEKKAAEQKKWEEHERTEPERIRAQLAFVKAKARPPYSEALGVFEPTGNAELSRVVQGFAGIEIPSKKRTLALKSADIKGTIALAADQADEPDFFGEAKPGIAFVGSFVEVTRQGIVQHEPSPEHRARVAYDFAYDAEAEPMLFLVTLNQIFRGDPDRAQKIDFLQEIAGMSLAGRGAQYQKVALFTGSGANGKSLVTSVIERCFPAESVIAVPPQSLDEDYKRARFTGAKLNIVSELPENEIVASEPWKAMVDGSKLSARSPYKDVFFFRTPATSTRRTACRARPTTVRGSGAAGLCSPSTGRLQSTSKTRPSRIASSKPNAPPSLRGCSGAHSAR